MPETSSTTSYKNKCTTAADAVSTIKSGDKIFIHANASNPFALVDALVERAPQLKDVDVFQLLSLGDAKHAEEKYRDSFRVQSLFIGHNTREAVNSGRGDYIPVFMSEIPELFNSKTIDLDVAVIQVAPPDKNGNCSLGLAVEATLAAAMNARYVIAEVNEQMPRTLGNCMVPLDKINKIIETNRPIPELISRPSTDIDKAIAQNIATLVEDQSTVQLGIGSIPNAVIGFLKNKKDLGIHTEMFSDGLLELIEAGVVTNKYKTVLPDKIAVSFVLGTKRVYDFVHENESVEFHPCDYINDPYIISQNRKMVAINSAIEVDLTGQVAADCIGSKLYSGFGGQVDFMRGTARSKGGKPIIALPSTAKNGSISKIVANLTTGAGVVTGRADVHYVITEYGIAQLHGKSLRERAKALIEIAHPKFRADLERSTFKVGS
ncbi:acetyl-CoA hydrolase/transferase family protein [bacterium]|nr:acetyl-CoA hydrolase/transferase family protein [bacterium]QQR56473.1 MAG: acetyl-CoA hydrolase/transferase family protein [Candidatus Melainabacteria bacterium]